MFVFKGRNSKNSRIGHAPGTIGTFNPCFLIRDIYDFVHSDDITFHKVTFEQRLFVSCAATKLRCRETKFLTNDRNKLHTSLFSCDKSYLGF